MVDRLASWIGETLAHHMLEVTDDVVVVLNADDRIVYVSRAAPALRWHRADVIGTAWDELVHPDDRGAGMRPPPGTTGGAAPEMTRGRVRVRCWPDEWVEAAMIRYRGALAGAPAGRDDVSLVVLRLV